MAFSHPTAILTEGRLLARVACLECGAAIIIDAKDDHDYAALHEEWHRQLDQRIRRAGAGSQVYR